MCMAVCICACMCACMHASGCVMPPSLFAIANKCCDLANACKTTERYTVIHTDQRDYLDRLAIYNNSILKGSAVDPTGLLTL